MEKESNYLDELAVVIIRPKKGPYTNSQLITDYNVLLSPKQSYVFLSINLKMAISKKIPSV